MPDECPCLMSKTTPNLSHKFSDKSEFACDKQDTFLFHHHTSGAHTEYKHKDDRMEKKQHFVELRSNMGIDR